MEKVHLAVIGGSGLYELSNVKIVEEKNISTPFGKPSDKITIGRAGDSLVAFLPRHGKGHRILPGEVPVKANIYALKTLGVEKVISVSAVGSLKEEIRPTDIVLPSQIIDKTKNRELSYFGGGIAGHISFADPFCLGLKAQIRDIILKYFSANKSSKKLFTEETYVCMEGPQFSTRAESNLHRSWGAGVIGMTAIPEAKLAREAEMCYVTIALATDYDCWKEGEEGVGISMVLEYMKENNKTINEILPQILESLTLDGPDGCSCGSAAKYAVMTSMDMMPPKVKKNLSLFYNKYWKD
ncbi:MAG: S-methyl-5'-thioadenosine phosphorylase [Brevinematales bacterium]|jgi:5'-methylthioadenosine phosphorylase